MNTLPVGIGAPAGAPPASQQTQRGSAAPEISLGLRGCAHPGRVRPDDEPLGHGISAPHCLGRSVACVATGQTARVVVRISVPARTALVTGVFSAVWASFARWSSSMPCRVISRSIHLVFRSLTT